MSTWDDDLKQKAISMYLAAEPTPQTSAEIVKDIAEELNQSPNGVRMILTKAEVYVKKDDKAKAPAKKADGTSGTTRVSKDAAHADLIAAIEAAGHKADTEIISKLTGKAAVYFTSLFK